MKKNNFTPFDNEEADLIESIENGEWEPLPENEQIKEIKKATLYAESTMKKDKRMNIRISERDLKNLKVKALEEGIPYQTLVSMVLHKYVTGKLKESA